MLNSVKIYNSSVSFSDQILYSEIKLPDEITEELKLGDKEILNYEFVKTKKSLFDSYFTKVDLFVYKKDNKILCSFVELDLQSEEISKAELKDNLSSIFCKYFLNEIKNLSQNVLYFIYKHNLLNYARSVIEFISDDSLISYLLRKKIDKKVKLSLNEAKEDKHFILILKDLKISTNLLTNLINPDKLKYFEKIYYFLTVGQIFESTKQLYSACVYYLRCYMCIKDGYNILLKKHLLSKIKKLNLCNNVFLNIIDKVRAKEEIEMKILLEAEHLNTLNLLKVNTKNKLCLELEVKSKEKILYFENEIIAFNDKFQNNMPIRFINTLKCVLKSDVRCVLLSIVGDEEIFFKRNLREGINTFYFNPRKLRIISEIKIKYKKEVYFIQIDPITLLKVSNDIHYRDIKIKEDGDNLIVKFYFRNRENMNVIPLVKNFKMKKMHSYVKFIITPDGKKTIFLVEIEDKTFLKYKIYKNKKEKYKVRCIN